MTPLQAAVDALAAYRITRLVTADTITGPARWRVQRWAYQRAGRLLPRDERQLGPQWDRRVEDELHTADTDSELPPKLAQLVSCRWCTGVWAGLGVVAARRLAPRQWAPLADALALAALAALVAGLESDG